MTPKEIDIALAELEERVDRLRALYEQYFMGYEKLEPSVPRKEVDRRFALLRKEQIRNTAQRFKFNVITQKFNTYAMYWGRICRQIEDGTYKRHVQRAKKRFGEAGPGRDDASFDVDVSDFDFGMDDDLDLDAVLAEADRHAEALADRAPTPEAPPAARPPVAGYKPASPVADGPAGAKPKLVRKKDGPLDPAAPGSAPNPAAPRAPASAPSARLPAALPPGAPLSSPRMPMPSSPGMPAAPLSSQRLPAAPPPGGPRAAGAPVRVPLPSGSGPNAPTPSSPAAPSPRLPAAPPPGAPFSSGRLPAAPPPGAPLSSPRAPNGAPLSSQRLPAAPATSPGASTGTGRFPAAPPPGGPRPMIRPAPGGPRAPTPSNPDLGEVASGERREREKKE